MLDDDKRLLRVTAGDPERGLQDLVAFARSVYEVPVPRQYDIAIGGVGFPEGLQPVPGQPRAVLSVLRAYAGRPAGRHLHYPGPLRGGRRRRRRRAAVPGRDARCARHVAYPGRCAPQRVSSGPAAGLRDGEGAGAVARDHRRQRMPGPGRCLQDDPGRHDGGSVG